MRRARKSPPAQSAHIPRVEPRRTPSSAMALSTLGCLCPSGHPTAYRRESLSRTMKLLARHGSPAPAASQLSTNQPSPRTGPAWWSLAAKEDPLQPVTCGTCDDRKRDRDEPSTSGFQMKTFFK